MENEQTVVETTEMAGQEPNASVGESATDKTEGANEKVPEVGKETASEAEKTVEKENSTHGESTTAEKQEGKKPEETRAENAEEKPEEAGKGAPADQRYAEAELIAACALAGIPKERIPFALRALDKGAVKNADDAEKEVNELLQAMPMFTEQPNGTGSTGAFARKQESEGEATRRNFAAGL